MMSLGGGSELVERGRELEDPIQARAELRARHAGGLKNLLHQLEVGVQELGGMHRRNRWVLGSK